MRALFLLAASVLAQEPTFRGGVELVTVAFSVMGQDGNFVLGLKKEDFTLYDNGKQIPIGQFWQDTDLPLTVALVVDISGSQRRMIEKHKQSMGHFLRQMLGHKDQALIVTLDGRLNLIQDFTSSAEQLQSLVDRLLVRRLPFVRLGDPCVKLNSQNRRSPCGGSIIWNSVFYTSRLKLKAQDGRKALILLTDGEDSGSDKPLVTAIEAAQGADTIVFPIQEPANGHRVGNGSRKKLARLAEETGGVLFDGTRQEPAEIFDRIEKELRSQYMLAFTPMEKSRDGKFHKLQVKLQRPGTKVRSRSGYYAPQR